MEKIRPIQVRLSPKIEEGKESIMKHGYPIVTHEPDRSIFHGTVAASKSNFAASGGTGGASPVSGAHILGSGGTTQKLRTIVCAAMKLGSVIIPCVRHWDTNAGMLIMQLKDDLKDFPHAAVIQGFLDSNGEFLDRKAAWIVAHDANQIRYRVPNDEKIGLNSENLY